MFDVAETVFWLSGQRSNGLIASLCVRHPPLALKFQKPLMSFWVWSLTKRNLNLIDSIGHANLVLENEVGAKSKCFPC